MGKFVIKATSENEAMFFHTVIFLFGHSVLEEFTEENQSVEMKKYDLLSFYNFLKVNYQIEYSLEDLIDMIKDGDDGIVSFLDIKIGASITYEE